MEQNVEKKWKELSVKDKISYLTAIGLMISGVILAFLSFFLNQYDIATGVLIYIAQCFLIGGGLIGASVYFKSKWWRLIPKKNRNDPDDVNQIYNWTKEYSIDGERYPICPIQCLTLNKIFSFFCGKE